MYRSQFSQILAIHVSLITLLKGVANLSQGWVFFFITSLMMRFANETDRKQMSHNVRK
jgi:hypothetical protein